METSYRADLIGEREEVLDGYRRIASVLAQRVDLILCETLASAHEAAWACEVASETGCEYWVSWTLQGTRLNTLPSGESLAEAVAGLGDLKPSAFLVNCCGANFVTAAIPELARLTSGPVGGYANADYVEPGETRTGVDTDSETAQERVAKRLDPEAYASEARRWLEAGAEVVGGCCGTRPAHIRRLREMLG